MIDVLIAGAILMIIYELWAAITKKAPTISQFVWDWSKRYPIVPFLFGLLMGHFFA